MAEYHVGCGSFAIYAGTLNAKNKNLWQNKTECTDEAIDAWNTRPVPPLGWCASCAYWDENTCECKSAADIDVAYHKYTEPNFFCGDYEPKGGEENG